MVHHVPACPKLLATVLGAVVRPLVVVHAHMDLQIMAIVELSLAPGHCADVFC